GESHDHLLFSCQYSKEVLIGVLHGLGLQPKEVDWSYLKGWIVKVERGKSVRARRSRRLFMASTVSGLSGMPGFFRTPACLLAAL
ncbi:hypothetical protein Dimus_013876, partial [Dionaea muscipula]